MSTLSVEGVVHSRVLKKSVKKTSCDVVRYKKGEFMKGHSCMDTLI